MMIKVFTVPVLVVLVFLLFSYLLLPIDHTKEEQVVLADSTVQSLTELLPLEEQHQMNHVKQDFLLVSKIVQNIKRDRIACIVPPKEEQNKKNDFKILLPDSAAFGGTAVLGNEAMIQMKNPLLEIAKNKQHAIKNTLTRLELQLDTSGDKFYTKFLRKSKRLQDKVDDMKNSIISECARQKSRLMSSHPHLTNYEFIDESRMSSVSEIPKYVHGTSMKPVSRQLM